jgi:hypothetical protein
MTSALINVDAKNLTKFINFKWQFMLQENGEDQQD